MAGFNMAVFSIGGIEKFHGGPIRRTPFARVPNQLPVVTQELYSSSSRIWSSESNTSTTPRARWSFLTSE